MNEIPDSERMALDFDGWLSSQDNDTRGRITTFLDATPETERQAAKDRLASQFIVAESSGLDLSEVDQDWDMIRGGFAAKKGEDWLAGVNDESAFHAKVKSEMQFRREERQLLLGPDDDKGPEAATRRKLSLVHQAREAAFAGLPYSEAFANWQGNSVVSKGWRADRTDAHNTIGRDVYERTAATVEKVKPIAEQAFGDLQELRGLPRDTPREGSRNSPVPVELFRGLSDDERGVAFRMISEKAKQQKGDKTRLQAFGEGVGRGFENLLIGLALNPLTMNEVFAKKFKAGDEVFGVNVEDYLGGGTEQKSQNIKKAEGLAELASSAIFSEKRKLTEAEAEEWNGQLKNIQEDLRTFEVLRKISTGEVDPTQNVGGFVFQKMVMPVADSTALLAGMATSGIATITAAAGQYSNENFQRLTQQGMDDAEALKIANVSGLAQAALDKAGFEFLKGIPAVNNVLKRFAMSGTVAGRFALNAGTTLAAETGIELMQDHVIPALAQDMITQNPAFDVNWVDVWRETAAAIPETALGMVLLSAGGGAFQTYADTKATRELSNSRSAMLLAGYTDAQIELIQQQPIAERGQLLSQFAPSQAPVGAEKDALVARVVDEAQKERAAFIEKLKAETGETADALDYAVRVTRRQETGWTVTTESGKNIIVDTAEAARRIRQDLAQASSQREAETLVALVEDWHLADTQAQRETTFTGETATSDGTSIAYKRDGKITREITDERTLETLRREAEIVASQTGNEAVNVIVNGSNQTFRTKVADAAFQVVQRLEINRSASSVLTFLHESIESNWRAGMQNGTLNREATQKAVASIAGAFSLDSGNAETRAFNERVQRVADGTATDDELRETVSELAVADVIGRRKDGGKVKVGSISQAISDAIQRAADESAVAGLSKLQAFIRAAKAFFRGVLGTVAAIRKAKQKNGKLAEDWEAFMHKLTGTSAQTEYDAGRVEDLQGLDPDYVPPTAEEEAAGIAFSASRATPSDTSNVIVAKDGTVLVGPTTFSISAYHGTPHKVDKFSMEKIGTGEGAQAYGWGLYFAESKAVAEAYRSALGEEVIVVDGLEVSTAGLSSAYKSALETASIQGVEKTLKDWDGRVADGDIDPNDSWFIEFKGALESWIGKEVKRVNKGALYTVELDVEPDELLDWDKPLSEQSEKVKKALAKFNPDYSPESDEYDANETGQMVYMRAWENMIRSGKPKPATEKQKELSEKMAKLGIPGIRYLDGNSRGYTVVISTSKGEYSRTKHTDRSAAEQHAANKRDEGFSANIIQEGTSNFVIFDESKIKITAENGKAVAFSDASKTTFSVSRASDAEYLDAVKRGDMATAQRMVDEAAKAAGYNIGPVWHASKEMFNSFDISKAKGKYPEFWFTGNKGYAANYGDNIRAFFLRNPMFSGEPDVWTTDQSTAIKSADPVTYDDAGNVIPLSQRFNEASNDIRFSLSPSAHVELLQRQVDTQLKRDPERRRKLAKAAGDKLQALQFAWETDRVNERGVKTRAIVELRSPASLSKEQAFREAARREELEAEVYAVYGEVLENESLGQLWGAGPVMEYLSNPTDKLHGRLMSKSQALKSGKFSAANGDYDGIDGVPRVVFGGSLMPDEVAQELYEAGVLKDASVDALWDTIRDELKSAARWKGFLKTAKEGLKKAKRQAHEEAAEWRREQDELQREDWNPKARLLRDMRALDAVISVLPPELRSKVGGFIKLAELTTDKARMKEIERRMKKLGGLVEDHLKKESIEEIERLIEKAEPATGPGEKPKGKITVEGHRVFAAVEAVRGMTTEQVDAERARLATAIEDGITKGESVIDLLEQEQILEMFGAIGEKTAAEADAAASWLDKVYRTGRNAWRMMEEARLAEVADLKEQTIASIGAASKSGTQEQKKNAAKLKAFAESASFQLLSFTQVLESVVGAGHPLVARWSRAAREATNQRTDAILGANARFEKAARDAFGGVSKLEMSRRLWAMSNDQRISLPVVEGGRSETLTVPIEKIRQFADGSVNPADLGYSPEEAADLIDQLNALPEKSRKKNLSVERILPGETKPAKYTEAEVLALTMLAKQEQYLPNLEKHGYTAEVIEAAESSLSDAAKAIRVYLLKEYADGYAPLSKVFREMFGIDLPSVANYSPAAFMHAGETRDVDPFGGMVAEGGFRAGFLKSRKEHLAAPRIENALQTFQGHVAQTEHWRAFAPLVRELRAVFGSVDVKDSILSNRGAGLANAAQSWISALEMNGLQQRAFMSALNPIFRYLTGRQATLTLAWKAGTLIKQSLAAISSAARLPAGVWLRGLSRVMSGKIDVSAIRNSPMIQRRIESGFSPEVRAAMVSLFNGKPSVWSRFVQAGMEKIGEVDAFFTSIGTAIVYDYHFNEGLKNGMSEAAAREMALVEAEDNLGRTAQPVELMDRSLYELGMSPAERVGFMFASNQRKDSALILSAWAQYKAGKITGAQFGQTLAVAWLAVGFGSALLGAAWRDANDDDDDQFLDWDNWNPVDLSRQALLGPLGGIPLLNMAYNSLLGYGPNDPFKPVKQMKSAVAKISEGDKVEPVEKTVRRVVDAVNGAAVFVPKLEGIAVGANIVEQAFNLADNFVSDTESEAEKKEKAATARERKAAREAK